MLKGTQPGSLPSSLLRQAALPLLSATTFRALAKRASEISLVRRESYCVRPNCA